LPVAGKAVAVTGAAQGIGAAIAEALVARGASVSLGDLDADLARGTAERLGPNALGLPLDVTDTGSFTSFVDESEARFGPLDVLVNNAGIMWVGGFADEPERTALAQFDVNFHGVQRGMKIVLPRMRERGRGQVVNVASVASKLAPPGEATYSASKHAVYGYTDAVRAELDGTGVKLSVVMPVVVETALAAGTSHGKGKRLQPGDVADAVVSAIERPRFDVFVPPAAGAIARVLGVLWGPPREALARALVPDQVKEADHSARAEYEQTTVADNEPRGDGAVR
jgi:NADP-dependent 3-hydroxy acid dehydrogenase YdfG